MYILDINIQDSRELNTSVVYMNAVSITAVYFTAMYMTAVSVTTVYFTAMYLTAVSVTTVYFTAMYMTDSLLDCNVYDYNVCHHSLL